jgi:hypothetical protein
MPKTDAAKLPIPANTGGKLPVEDLAVEESLTEKELLEKLKELLKSLQENKVIGKIDRNALSPNAATGTTTNAISLPTAWM